MKRTRATAVLSLAGAAAVALSACGSSSTAGPEAGSSSSASSKATASLACSSGSLTGGGSSFQAPIQSEWIAGVKKACSGLTVDYQSSSSGTGIMNFGSGTVDFAGTDALMKDTEQSAADARCGSGNKALHVPVIAGGVTVLYKLNGVSALKLSPTTIASIFAGKITKWDDDAIKADNSGVTLPSTAITAVHRSDSSGTTNVFTSYLSSQASSVWTYPAAKDFPTSLSGQAFKGSDGTTGYVKDHDGSITYAEEAYSLNAGLPEASVKNASGAYVAPTSDGVSAALNTATVDTSKGDLRVKIDFGTTDAKAYPIAAVTYDLVCDKGNKNAAALKTYMSYVAGAGQAAAVDAGYAPLPTSIDTQVTTLVGTLA